MKKQKFWAFIFWSQNERAACSAVPARTALRGASPSPSAPFPGAVFSADSKARPKNKFHKWERVKNKATLPGFSRRWSQIGRRCSGTEITAAVSTFFPGRLNRTPAAGAGGAQGTTTLRTKDEADASAGAALRTLDEQWIAED